MKLPVIFLLIFFSFYIADAGAEGKWEGTGFSADFSQTFADEEQENLTGRFYLDSHGMRMEMTEDGQAMVSIMRFKENDMLMLMPDTKMYMVMPYFAQNEDATTTLEAKFAGACADYLEQEKVGSETINGRQTEKWRCEQGTDDDADADIWFDVKLAVPILVEDDDGGRFEITNIKEGEQSADLFQPPAGYKTMSMQDMMKMGD